MRTTSTLLFTLLAITCLLAPSFQQDTPASPAGPASPETPKSPETPAQESKQEKKAGTTAKELACQYPTTSALFNLTGVMTEEEDDKSTPLLSLGEGYVLYYRFCSGNLKVAACQDKKTNAAVVHKGECHPIHLQGTGAKFWSSADNANPTQGVNLSYPYVIKGIPDLPEMGTFSFNFQCNNETSVLTYKGGDFNKKGSFSINLETKNGECSFKSSRCDVMK
jgi:hypothetical protein